MSGFDKQAVILLNNHLRRACDLENNLHKFVEINTGNVNNIMNNIEELESADDELDISKIKRDFQNILIASSTFNRAVAGI